MNFDNKNKLTGGKRIVSASANSYRGLKWLTNNESAFQQELMLAILLCLTTVFLEVTSLERVLLISSLLLVLLVETINTAIEAVVDRIGLELHELSGLAKDLGSSAVLISLTLAAVIWGGILCW